MKVLKELKSFLILWLTQAFSSLGSSMTSFALVIRLYQDSGSALTTALLTVCSYAPYVVMSIFAGIETVIFFDLFTFAAAFVSLALFIKIPKIEQNDNEEESLLRAAKGGLLYLQSNKGILWLILFLSAINLIASMYNAALPAMVLSKSTETALGLVNSCVGIATLIGSVIATFYPEPKSRVRVICNCLLLSMSTENFLLALGRGPIVWYIGAVLGWIVIPLMNANYDVIFRSSVPKAMQGRVYSVRNTLQFFTIPVGYFLGGFLVDSVFEPLMATTQSTLLKQLFGSGKGSGAALLFFVIGVLGVLVCLIFRNVRHLKELE